ncbi:hypothetical protein ACAG96_08875 [Candidatus Izemoplasma sp. B36]|uniref:hypothetical protein n=1 Tax=Candidatus Izemoplasma sp. B36 TaxID=3242468 RepID=UPI0035576CFB
MGIKEVLNEEVKDLKKVKRPYETVAFVLFAILILQQLIYLGFNLIRFIGGKTTFLSTNGWCTSNLMNFVARIINLGSTNWFYIILGILAFVLYYFLIYVFVWNYAKKNNLAKWTWTLFIVFGPTIILIPPYIWFAVYAFRPYIARFIKRFIKEFKAYDPEKPMPEDIPEPEPKPEPKPEPTPEQE